MKRIVLFLILASWGLGATAQNITVKSFRALPTDITASSKEGKRYDQNGQVAALIKVMTNETGFAFEGGALGILDTQQRIGEIWVWVPRGLRKITILHPKYRGLRDYMFTEGIEAERTYEMVLEVEYQYNSGPDENKPTQQYLAFQISPKNASLEVNDLLWEVDEDGNAQEYVDFGEYSYRVQANNYHPDAGKVLVNNPDSTIIVTIALRPNFGWVEVSGDGNLRDASVYIDNTLIGKAPCKSEALKSGEYSIRVAKKMFVTYSGTVTVNDNEITHIAPQLQSDYAEVTLTVDSDAEIWVNDERKGVRSWKGLLGRGNYKIECKQTGHETTLASQEITPDMNGKTIQLPAPKPISGSLNVESSPKFCQLYIDGQDKGTTPKSINDLLIGTHQIRMSKEGYEDYVETITIVKGERKQLKATLNKIDYFAKGKAAYDAKNYGEALRCFRLAADQGHAAAQNNLGYLYDEGLGVAKDYAEAAKWYRKAADQNHAHAQCNLGYMYEKGHGVAQSDTEAAKWYQKAANQGNAIAQYNMGVMYDYGKGVTKNSNEALKWYQKAANQGIDNAQKRLKQ